MRRLLLGLGQRRTGGMRKSGRRGKGRLLVEGVIGGVCVIEDVCS